MQLNYYAIGQRIQGIRKERQLSQAMLSAIIDKSPGYISYIEQGTKTMSLETFVSIANALEVSTDTLLNRQLTAAGQIVNREVLNVFSNCSPYETYIILDIMKAAKRALQEQKHLLTDMRY